MTQGLWAAIVAGAFSVLVLWLQRRGARSALEEAWRAQVQQLIDRLGADHAAELARCDEQLAAKDDQIAALLRRRRGDGNDVDD